MGRIFASSDLHFGHDREFLWGPRGFRSSIEHDEAIIANWNSVVEPVYPTITNVELIGWADMIHYRKYHFYLSHFPTNTANIEAESLHQCTLNLFGHTHSPERFREDYPMYYNVALDANHNTPVLLDDIIDRMKEKVQECISYL